MPWARTTSQGSVALPVLLPAVGRMAAVALLGVLLALPAVPAAGAGSPAGGQSGAAEGTLDAGRPEPTAVQRAADGTTSPSSPPEPDRLGGAVTPRRSGLPTVLAVVLVLGVASLQVRLLLAEPSARRAESSTAARPTVQRRPGVGSPRW